MSVTDKAIEHLRTLPEPKQAQVLDFIEFLERAAGDVEVPREEPDWSDFSLAQAMRGMEDEPSPYTADDLKEHFS